MKNKLRGTDILARLGGDEFALILPGCQNRCAMNIAEKLWAKINDLIIKDSVGVINVSCSGGGASSGAACATRRNCGSTFCPK